MTAIVFEPQFRALCFLLFFADSLRPFLLLADRLSFAEGHYAFRFPFRALTRRFLFALPDQRIAPLFF